MLRSACLFLLIFAGIAAADVQTGVVRSGGQAIPGATVSAECGADSKITTTTDDAGRFEIGGLPSTSCKYTVLMFGFEPAQKDAAASSTPLGFDLSLQTHATMPTAPKPATAVAPPAPAVTTAAPPAAAPPTPAPATPDLPKPSMAAAAAAANAPAGRGGRNGARGASGAARGATPPTNTANGRAGGRGGAQTAAAGRGGQAGFQSLSLVQNEDAPAASDAPAATLGGGDTGTAAGDAFTVNGTLSQGVQAQAGDGLGMGGGGGFGFGPGGPGGLGGDPFGAGGGAGGDLAGGGVTGGRGGGGGAPGGRGGGGGAPGGGRGGGGGFAGGGGGRGGGGARGGGPGGPGGRGGRGPNGVTAFGNRAGRGRGPQWQAGLTYNFTNSALNARPYSVASASANGLPPVKPATATNQLGITLGGPIMIPKTKINLKNSRWNVNVTGARNRVGVENVSSVPIPAFRTGDFSSLLGNSTPIVIYDPLNNQPFAGNIIPQSRLNSAALGLLTFYPSPTGVGLVKNYEFDASNPSNSNTLSSSLIIPITPKDRVNVNISAQSRNSATIQTFGFRDPTSGGGKSLSVSYSRTLRPTLVNNFSASVNRNSTNNLSFFSNGVNIAALYGINGILATPPTYGPPTLSFQGGSQLAGLSDSVPSTNHSTTFSLTEGFVKNLGKHTIQVGITGSKQESNRLTANNARGTFSFTGVNTQQQVTGANGVATSVPNTGYDLADFLLGLPAQTSITNYLNGNNMFYYRQMTAAAYANDDFRMSTKITINGGLRWEFYAPQKEKYNHMANLEFSPDGASVNVVTPGMQYRYAGTTVPDGLISTYYKMIEPQIGFAAKPWSKRAIVIRGGYGIRYNGGAIAQLGSRLTIQPPFVQTFSLTPAQALAQTGKTLTLQNGFPTLPASTITNNYAVSPDYRPAMAQQWNAIVQYTLGRSYVVQTSYSGTKGTNLDVLFGPNRATPGPVSTEASRIPIPYALTTIQFDRSIGSSIYHSGSAQVTRRLTKGFGGSVTYTLAKAISDSSILGSGVVQSNLAAERAVTSDPHQNLAVNFNYQSLANNQKSQFYWNLIRGWQLSGAYDVTSGSPFTATVAGDPTGTGVIGSRANATGLPVTGGNCATCTYFNTAAFTSVPQGTFGTAGRNTIPGIVNFSLRASAMRSFRIGERHRLSLTFTANNPLNHVSITGVGTQFGTSTYGLATRAGNMRTVSAMARFTF